METVLSFIFKLAFFVSVCSMPLIGQDRLAVVAPLSSNLKEISGIVKGKENTYLAINDSGNPNEVFVLNEKGEILKRVKVVNAKNVDWEAITTDQNGYVYIGDIGNNSNRRNDLVIYKIYINDIYTNSSVFATKIEFSYADQNKFPPNATQKNYDAEALVIRYDRIYLFTKNRTNPYSGYTYLYTIPNREGKHSVKKTDSLYTGNVLAKSWITDAALSKDLRHLALLSHEKVWLISDFHRDLFLSGFVQEIDLNHHSQKEGICFKNDSILTIVEETSTLFKGKLNELNVNTEITYLDSLRRKEVHLMTKDFEDSLLIQINLVVAGDVFFEIFDGNLTRVDFARIDHFQPGEHSFYVKPKNMINGSYMLNIIVGNRPHGFFVKRFKEVDWDELYHIRDSIQRSK